MVTKFMTNIDSYFYTFLDKESKQNNISKRELLENIIADYIERKKQEEIKASYASMGKDEEYLYEMQENTKYLGNL